MDRGNTKQEIMEVSLYSHFESKQEILDTIVKDILEQYEVHSIFADADWENDDAAKDRQALTPDAAAKMIQGQIRYILHDPHISTARKMLVMEQFQNPEPAKLCLPISTWINLCDREPDREQEVMELVDRHIHQFFRLQQTEAQ